MTRAPAQVSSTRTPGDCPLLKSAREGRVHRRLRGAWASRASSPLSAETTTHRRSTARNIPSHAKPALLLTTQLSLSLNLRTEGQRAPTASACACGKSARGSAAATSSQSKEGRHSHDCLVKLVAYGLWGSLFRLCTHLLITRGAPPRARGSESRWRPARHVGCDFTPCLGNPKQR